MGADTSQGGRAGVVGYMQGKGGEHTRSPVEAVEDWRAVFALLRGRVDALETQAMAVEDALGRVARTLERSQPPMFKAVFVRWWALRGGQRRAPVLVRREGSPGGKVRFVQVGPEVKLRRDRGFGLCADLAQQAVRDFRALVAVRNELLDAVSAAGAAVGNGGARRERVVVAAMERMTQAADEAERRLREVGYGDGEYGADA